MKPITVPDLSTRPFQFKVERIMNASADVLFQAWTKQFDRWFAAPGTLIMDGEVNTVFFFETRYKLDIHSEEQRAPHYGRFLRLVHNRLIEMTWVTGVGGTNGVETIVTVELEPSGSGTNLRLTHAGFLNEESKTQHEISWPFVLEQLDHRMTARS